LLLGEDTLVKIIVRNTGQKLITHLGEQQFQWSVLIDTEPAQLRKEIKKVIYHLHPTFPNKDVVKTKESEGSCSRRMDGGGVHNNPRTCTLRQ
jgi:hypothetical protein